MASAELVAGVRKALRLSANTFDDEITELIEAARCYGDFGRYA